jgi:hypothetical protein
MIGYVDRQAQKRKLRRAKLADLLLALLAARLSDMAYHETYSVLEKDLRSPALSDVPGGLRILHFRRQRPEASKPKELHPQWFLARGALPRWAERAPAMRKRRRLRAADDDDDDGEDDDGGGGGALYLVFRGTSSKTDILRDICVEVSRCSRGQNPTCAARRARPPHRAARCGGGARIVPPSHPISSYPISSHPISSCPTSHPTPQPEEHPVVNADGTVVTRNFHAGFLSGVRLT